MTTPKGPIVVLDFGSQFAHLLAAAFRRAGARAVLASPSISAADLRQMNPAGVVLSGGPQSVDAPGSPQPDPDILALPRHRTPIFGVCYGHHLLARHFGARIAKGPSEFGPADFSADLAHPMFDDVPPKSTVWMNHGDSVGGAPNDCVVTGTTRACAVAAFAHRELPVFSVQFHPEVTHTEYGQAMLKNFIDACGAAGTWSAQHALEEAKAEIERAVPKGKKVFLLVSGGVDSTVAFALLRKQLGEDRVVGLFVDTGLLREDEAQQVPRALEQAGLSGLHVADAGGEFFASLEGLTSPEDKRHAIGSAFLRVKSQWAQQLGLAGPEWLLGQGTIYPDHIETGGSQHADKIKTHHNRVPEIEQLMAQGRVVEPLKNLYKDEVRQIGRALGLPSALVDRHPFPGPGLGVRILCHSTNADPIEADALAAAQQIEAEYGLPARVLPIRSVGVQGDARSFRRAVAVGGSQPPTPQDAARAAEILGRFPIFSRVVCPLAAPAANYELAGPSSTITPRRAALLARADAAVHAILQQKNLMSAVWQFPVVLLPAGPAGRQSIALRPIESENAMTASPVVFSPEVFAQMCRALLAIDGIGEVFVDLSTKPPGTIEWE